MAFPIRRATPQYPPLNKGRSRLVGAKPAVVVAGQRPTIIRAAQKSVARRAGNDLNSGIGPIVRGGAQWIQAPQAVVVQPQGDSPAVFLVFRNPSPTRPVADANSGIGPVSSLRTGSQWVQAPAGAAPPTAPRRTQGAVRKQIKVGRSRPVSAPQAVVVTGQRPVITRAPQKSVARRAGNDLNSGIGPLVRGGAQWIQSPQYNSGGLTPEQNQGVRRSAPTRRSFLSRLQVALAYNSGGLLPLRAQGVRRPVSTRGLADLNSALGPVSALRGGTQWIQSQYSSGGLTPSLIRGAKRPAAKQRSLSSPQSAPVYNSGGLTPFRAQGVRRQASPRAVADSNNGLGPVSAIRGGPLWIQVPAAVVIAVTPSLVRGAVRKPARVGRSRLVVAAQPVLVAAIRPSLVRALRRPVAKVHLAQFIQPTVAMVVIPGDTPAVFLATRPLPPSIRLSSRRQVPPTFAPGPGSAPYVTRAVQKPTPRRPVADANGNLGPVAAVRGGSQWLQAALYNSGGLLPNRLQALRRLAARVGRSHQVLAVIAPLPGAQPLVLRAAQKPTPKRSSSRLVVPPIFVPSVGVQPIVLRALRRRPIPRSNSRLVIPGAVIPSALRTRGAVRKPIPRTPSRWAPAPPYNSGGITPRQVRGVCRKPAPVKPSRLVRSASYNSGGLKPLFTAVPRQKPPTRGYRSLPHSGLGERGLSPLPLPTSLRFYVDDQEPPRSLNSAEAATALLDREPAKGLISNEPSPSLTDTEPPPGITRVRGQ